MTFQGKCSRSSRIADDKLADCPSSNHYILRMVVICQSIQTAVVNPTDPAARTNSQGAPASRNCNTIGCSDTNSTVSSRNYGSASIISQTHKGSMTGCAHPKVNRAT